MLYWIQIKECQIFFYFDTESVDQEILIPSNGIQSSKK